MFSLCCTGVAVKSLAHLSFLDRVEDGCLVLVLCIFYPNFPEHFVKEHMVLLNMIVVVCWFLQFCSSSEEYTSLLYLWAFCLTLLVCYLLLWQYIPISITSTQHYSLMLEVSQYSIYVKWKIYDAWYSKLTTVLLSYSLVLRQGIRLTEVLESNSLAKREGVPIQFLYWQALKACFF